MADRPKAFDVWFVEANTVYKRVPLRVVTEWTGGGRLGPADRLRPAGTEAPWQPLSAFELVADYAPRAATVTDVAAPPTDPEADDWEPPPPRRRPTEDDDPDMIPLIDVSLVLLIFFMLVRAAGTLSPVDVPDMQYTGAPSTDPTAVTIAVERRGADDVVYSVRTGDQAAPPEGSNLPTPEAAIAALDRVVGEAQRPPDVRVACEKALPSDRVFELIRELQARKDRGRIGSYQAEVNERAKP